VVAGRMMMMLAVMMTVMATEGRTRKSRTACVTCPEDSRLWGRVFRSVLSTESSWFIISVCSAVTLRQYISRWHVVQTAQLVLQHHQHDSAVNVESTETQNYQTRRYNYRASTCRSVREFS
jgi:hypothetical protein